jgi:hypothetical protein
MSRSDPPTSAEYGRINTKKQNHYKVSFYNVDGKLDGDQNLYEYGMYTLDFYRFVKSLFGVKKK